MIGRISPALLAGSLLLTLPGVGFSACGGPPTPLGYQSGVSFNINITRLEPVPNSNKVKITIVTRARENRGDLSDYKIYRNVCLTTPTGQTIESGHFAVGARDVWNWTPDLGSNPPKGHYTAHASVWAARNGRNFNDYSPADNKSTKTVNVTVDNPTAQNQDGADYVFTKHEIITKPGGRYEFNAEVRNNGVVAADSNSTITWTVERGLDADGPLATKTIYPINRGRSRNYRFILDLNDYGGGPFGEIAGKVRLSIDDADTSNNETGWGMDLSGGAVAPSIDLDTPEVNLRIPPTREEQGAATAEGFKIYNRGGLAEQIQYKVVVTEPAGYPDGPVTDVTPADKPSKEWGPLTAPQIDLGWCRDEPTELKVKVVAWAFFKDSQDPENILRTAEIESEESEPVVLEPCPPECTPQSPDWPECRQEMGPPFEP